MSNFNYQILHLEQHKNFAFKSAVDFNFAREMLFVPIVFAEIFKIVIELPIFFIANENKESNENINNKNYELISLLAVQNNLNVMVGPNGKWAGQYIPANLRHFPFTLKKIQQKDSNDNIQNSLTLCIEQSYLIPPEIVATNETLKENLIFDEQQQNLNEKVKQILNLLQQMEGAKLQTLAIIEVLKKHNLIIPFAHKVLKIDGLFCIDEKLFNELSAEALKELQQCGGLLLCYSQILSMQNIDRLIHLNNFLISQQMQVKKLQQAQAQAQAQIATQNTNTTENKNIAVNTENFFKGDTINFEGLF